MGFQINDWNINPNQVWFVVLYDAEPGIGVLLYDGNPNMGGVLVGTGACSTYNGPVVLMGTGIEYFNSQVQYHLKVSGASGDPQEIFRVGEFVDLPDVEDPIYQDQALVQIKIRESILQHTKTKHVYSVNLATHTTNRDLGGVERITSSRIDSVTGEVEEIVIVGELHSLTDRVSIATWEDFTI
jgi:hypothetical protein